MNSEKRDYEGIARSIGTNALLLFGMIVSLAPIYYMVISTSFSLTQFYQFPPRLLPSEHLIENYNYLIKETVFPQTLLNTLIYTIGATIGTVIVATTSGYAFSMFRFRFRKPIFALILAMMSVPFQLVAIALFALLIRYGMIDTYLGAILPVIVFPLAILMMKQNFDQLDLEEIMQSARVDGASEIQIFYHIALPLMRPAIAAAIIITFLWRSGELFWPVVVFQSKEMFTVTQFIANNMGYRTATDWTVIMPAGFILTIPSIIVAVYFQKHFVRGLTAGSVK